MALLWVNLVYVRTYVHIHKNVYVLDAQCLHSRSVIVNDLGEMTIASEFESHWVTITIDFFLNQIKYGKMVEM